MNKASQWSVGRTISYGELTNAFMERLLSDFVKWLELA